MASQVLTQRAEKPHLEGCLQVGFGSQESLFVCVEVTSHAESALFAVERLLV